MRTRFGFILVLILTLTACTTTASPDAAPATQTPAAIAIGTNPATPAIPAPATPSPTAVASSGTVGKTPPASTLYDSAARNRDVTQLNGDEMRWQQAGITSYRISVAEITTFSWQTNTVTVRDGNVVDQSATCQRALTGPDPCTVRTFKAEDFTIPGLFARARRIVNDPSLVVTLETDARYGYLSRLGSSTPNTLDSGYSLRVTAFEPL